MRKLSLFLTIALLGTALPVAAQQNTIYAFSPGTPSPKKLLVIPFSISDSRYVKSWHFVVTDAAGKPVYTKEDAIHDIAVRPENALEILKAFFKPKRSVSVPKEAVWDGKNNSGTLCPDGDYFFYISATDDNDNYGETKRFRVNLDTKPPFVSITQPRDQDKVFGDAGKPALAIQQSGSREDLWSAEIKDEAGKTVRSYQWRDSSPQPFTWDGKDNQGITLPDGVYRYSISAVDAAGNASTPAGVPNIRLESITPEAEVGRSVAELAPNGKNRSQTFTIKANLQTGISSWKFEVVPAQGSGAAPAQSWSGSGALRQKIEWNGKRDDGSIPDGSFKGVLTITYAKGNVVHSETPPFFVTGYGPQLNVVTQPKQFSPDDDGENDRLTLALTADSVLPVSEWALTINDPTPQGKPFKTWTGKSEVPKSLEWNGRGDNGDLVESAMDYPFVFTARDSQEQSGEYRGTIPIDVLVMRDGDRYVIRVPAIIFRANHADFVGKEDDRKRGLEPAVIENNMKVLTRVAQILQKFGAYRVTIEGHANSETGKPEEEKELGPLSKERAEFVKQQLINLGVSGGRLTTEGVGGKRPVMKNRKDRDNWWKNRRVEFILQR